MPKQLPAVVEMEKKLLSAMMLENGEAIPTIVGIVSAEDFYRPDHQIIFRAIINVYSRGVPPDILLIEQELIQSNEYDKINRRYLFSLIDQEFTTARVEAQAVAIRDKAILRRLIAAGEEIADDARNERNDVKDILEDAERRILSVSSKMNQSGFEILSSILQKSFERIQHIHNHPEDMEGVTTGLTDLNKITNGLHKADLILLAARPSMGKTALALNIAINAARAKNKVVIFSLEMSKVQLGNRLLSTASGVNSFYLNTGNLSNDDMNSLINAVQDLEYMKLFIDDTPGITLLEMRSRVRRIKHEYGLDLIVIDYLQLMQGGTSRLTEQNRQQEISEISRNLKALARELDVPVLALSQLSRSVEMRAEKKPQLSDLRESGSLEQDADIVMFLYRDEYYNRDETENENIAELIIAKNRNGPTTSIRLQFQKEIMRFGDLTRVEM